MALWPKKKDPSVPVAPAHIHLQRAPLPEPRRRRHRIKRLLLSSGWVGAVGLVALFVAAGGEEFHEAIKPGSAAADVGSLVWTHILTWAYFFHFLAEVGIAFLIAAIVAFFIEATARREQTDSFERALQILGESVIEGVYHIRHDKEYVKAVVSSCVAVRYIRRDVVIAYHLNELTPEEAEALGVGPHEYVRVDVEFKYQAVNISESPATLPALYTIPIKPGNLADMARMKSLTVDGDQFSPDEIAELELKPGDRDYNASDRTYRFPIPTKPNIETSVRILAEFLKLRSDTEVFAFLLPTVGATIRFNFQMEGLLPVGAKARTATPMQEPPRPFGRQVEWYIPGALLPNNHVSVWWVTDPLYLEAMEKGEHWPPLEAPEPHAIELDASSVDDSIVYGGGNGSNRGKTTLRDRLRGWATSAMAAFRPG